MSFTLQNFLDSKISKSKGRPKKYLMQAMTFEAKQLLKSKRLKEINISKEEAKKHKFLWNSYNESRNCLEVFYTPSVCVYGSLYLTEGLRLSKNTQIDIKFTPIFLTKKL